MLTWGPPGTDRLIGTREGLRRLIEVFGVDARVLDVLMILKVARGRVH